MHKEWLKEEIKKLITEESQYMPHDEMVDLGLVLSTIDQLEEPEKVVIPKFVADYIELNKGWSEDRQEYIEDDSNGLWFALDGNSYGMPNSVSDWLFNEEKVETFAKAWLDGFTVANEDKQEVEENFYTFDNAKKWLQDNGFVVFEKDKLDEEVQRMVSETYEAMNEKPVIPQFVANFIRATKPNNSLRLAFEYIAQQKIDNYDDGLAFWIEEGNSELFARAWIDGYEVEKEKRYQVKIPITVWDDDASELKEHTLFLAYDITSGETRILSPTPRRGDFRTDLTESEIKAIDKRYWAFAEEVME